MINFWFDVQLAVQANLKLVHLTAEPVRVDQVSEEGFGRAFHQTLTGHPAAYDFQTKHAKVFGGVGRYQYSKRESIQAIRAYAQSEPVTLKAGSAA
ncbi:hypothetical protein ACQ858_18730 [Variovorax ureilyticus]|uniref:hypothetical protein n=1 Tax=Variovorax ureilyticus TaxID=1836198 RepID=UPI003D6671EF